MVTAYARTLACIADTNAIVEYTRGGIVARPWYDKEDWTEVRYEKRFSAAAVVKRALSRVGESDYNLLWNNCEHFAYWATENRSVSQQVRHLGFAAVGATAVGFMPRTHTGDDGGGGMPPAPFWCTCSQCNIHLHLLLGPWTLPFQEQCDEQDSRTHYHHRAQPYLQSRSRCSRFSCARL